MLSVLADENFNQRILRGLKLRISKLDLILAGNLPSSIWNLRSAR